MGLDACVFCDCYEKGKVRMPPPQPELVYLEETGQVSLRWECHGADQHLFFDWLQVACEHGPFGMLVSHRLGNVALIAFLRGLLSKTPERFPVSLTKVVYDGTHAGDFLSLKQVEALVPEMNSIRDLHCAEPDQDRWLRQFESQMEGLIQASRRLLKPIAFL